MTLNIPVAVHPSASPSESPRPSTPRSAVWSKSSKPPNINVDVINIGNEKELTINELADIIVKETNSKSKIIHKEKMPDDPKRREPDISRAREFLKWEPKITFDSGLKKTIDWISENKNSFS